MAMRDWMLVAPRYVPVAALACHPSVEIHPVSLKGISYLSNEHLAHLHLPAKEFGVAFRG